MPTDALVLAPVLLAAVLALSAYGKLRAPDDAARAFVALRVPAALSRPWMVRALPWGEAALALGLVLVSGPAGVGVAVVAVALVVAYFVLVVRALGFDEDVDCACFGSLGQGTVTRLTVVRNSWLVVLVAVSLAVAGTGTSPLASVTNGSAPWWWLVAAAAAAATTGLVLGGAGAAARAGATADDQGADMAVQQEDYLRVRTPAVPVTLGDGSETQLRRLSRERPQLLLYVSEHCGSCEDVRAAVPAWRAALPPVDVRLVLRTAPGQGGLTETSEPLSLHDVAGLLHETFELRTPSAVLLGADGMLAGGPVVGSLAVAEFVDDIMAELAAP